MNITPWNRHYMRSRSRLGYPDENLVRELNRHIRESSDALSYMALDMGCGSGRHCALLKDLGFNAVFGADISLQGLKISSDITPLLIQADNRSLPFKNNSFGTVVAWGSLHYNHKSCLPEMISEIKRILVHGGRLFATLRTDHDTMLRKGKDLGNNIWETNIKDIDGSIVSFYSLEETENLFQSFGSVKIGIMERSQPGKLDERVSHWIINAEVQKEGLTHGSHKKNSI